MGELRVAQLAAAGHTNRQIAQALLVTQRTVENHLTSTYAKLGIGSRGALAAALADVHTAASTLEILPQRTSAYHRHGRTR